MYKDAQLNVQERHMGKEKKRRERKRKEGKGREDRMRRKE